VSYLLDTNVLSELVRTNPVPAVVSWFDTVPDDSLYISVLTVGEIRKGVELIPDGGKKEKLRVWLEHTLPDWFEDRMLAIDGAVAEQWGRMLAAVNRPVAAIDSLLAATALHHDLRMVTRNAQDFRFPGLEVIDPWTT
jgi:toxin FitB